MGKELYIQKSDEGADIALLDNGRLVELHHERVDEDYLVGDIYLGRIRKLSPNLNAAFVDLGHEKDGFLHYLDLGPEIKTFNKFFELAKKGRLKETRVSNFRPEVQILKTGRVDDVFKPGDHVVVQIVKEPIGTKGPRLGAELSLSGRYLILMPFAEDISLSKKIKGKDERDRLRKILGAIRPKGYGLIIRTNAEGASAEALEADLNKLLLDWDAMVNSIAGGNTKLHSELDRSVSIMRDLLNDDFTRIVVDAKTTETTISTYLKTNSPDKVNILEVYAGKQPLFEKFNIERQKASLFNRIVNLGGGSYIVIEHTEAMHVIDVNSGSKRNRDEGQNDTALRTNLEAAGEIVRQLRLRDMGGIICVDFIDMRSPSHRKMLYDRMSEMMKKEDRAKHTVLPLSKFGVMQITRQRVRQEMNLDHSEPCPVCNGTGKITKGLMVTEDIRRAVDEKRSSGAAKMTLKVHPFVHAYLLKNPELVGEPKKTLLSMFNTPKVKIESQEDYLINQYELVGV